MSNGDGITKVTEKLRDKLNTLSGRVVTTDSLDALPSSTSQNQKLNLHLYQIQPNANWRNMDIPWKSKPGESYHAPLALDLRYLLTATATDQTEAQRDLGAGMRALHDNPVLDPGGAAIAPFERARITMQPLSLDDMEKLWAGVAKPRRLSVAYEVSVVLIESEQPVRSSLPVLTRGTGRPDSIEVQPNLDLYLYPTIERIEIGIENFDKWLKSRSRPSRTEAQVDDSIFLFGQGLTGKEAMTTVTIAPLMHPKESVKVSDVSVDGRGGLTVKIPSVPAGPCSIALTIKRDHKEDDVGPDQDLITNAMPFSLAPTIISITPAMDFAVSRNLAVEFKPPLAENQAVVLIIAGVQVPPKPTPQKGDSSAMFKLEKIVSGKYRARLRVDGVDSIVIDLKMDLNAEHPFFSEVSTVAVP
jgi:hypothetical protein